MFRFKTIMMFFFAILTLSACNDDVASEYAGDWTVQEGSSFAGQEIQISFMKEGELEDDVVVMTVVSQVRGKEVTEVEVREDGIYLPTLLGFERLMYRNEAGEMMYGPLVVSK